MLESSFYYYLLGVHTKETSTQETCYLTQDSPKIGLDWSNKNANDGLAKNKYQDLFPEKTTFVVQKSKRNQKGDQLEA